MSFWTTPSGERGLLHASSPGAERTLCGRRPTGGWQQHDVMRWREAGRGHQCTLCRAALERAHEHRLAP